MKFNRLILGDLVLNVPGQAFVDEIVVSLTRYLRKQSF